MIDYFDLIQEHASELAEAQRQNQEALKHGTRSYEMNRMHKMKRAAKVLELRAASKLPANLAQIVADGDDEVSSYALQRDCEEALAKASSEAVQLHKRRADFIRDQINREGYVPRRENL